MRIPRLNESRLCQRPRSIAALLATGTLLAAAWAGSFPHSAAAGWDTGVFDLANDANVRIDGAFGDLDGEEGPLVGDQAGYSVAGAGDVNGDGLDDVIVGAPAIFPFGSGLVNDGATYVVFGSNSTTTVDLRDIDGAGDTAGFRIVGAADDEAGYSVAGAGDVDGDGLDDVIVGADRPVPASRAGAAYVVFGRRDNSETTPEREDAEAVNLAGLGERGIRIDGTAYDRAGTSVAGAGDVNHDGRDDVIVGAFSDSPTVGGTMRLYAGSAYIIFGDDSTDPVELSTLGSPGGDPGFRIAGAANQDRAGRWVAGAGDVNNDGTDDVIVGAVLADTKGDGSNTGAAYVVFGSSSSTEPVDLNTLGGRGFRIDGAAADDNAGRSVAAAGDLNEDGFDDVIVGAYYADVSPEGQARERAGSAYVVYGKDSTTAVDLATLGSRDGFPIMGATAYDYAGTSVDGAGDVNGDGKDDVIVGANYADSGDPARLDAGAGYLVFGTSSTATVDLDSLGSKGAGINGGEAWDQAGHSVAGAGDVNGDGGNDVIVGAPFANPEPDGSGPRSDAGAAYIIFGAPPPVPLPPEPRPSPPPAPDPSPTLAPQPFDAGTPVAGTSQPRLGAFSIRLRCASSAGKQGGRKAARFGRCTGRKPRQPALEVRFTASAAAKVTLRVTQRAKRGKGKRRRGAVESTVLRRTLDARAGANHYLLKIPSKVASARLTGKVSVDGGAVVLKAPVTH